MTQVKDCKMQLSSKRGFLGQCPTSVYSATLRCQPRETGQTRKDIPTVRFALCILPLAFGNLLGLAGLACGDELHELKQQLQRYRATKKQRQTKRAPFPPQLIANVVAVNKSSTPQVRGQLLKTLIESRLELATVLSRVDFTGIDARKQKLVVENLREILSSVSFRKAYSSKTYQSGSAVFGGHLQRIRLSRAKLDGCDLHSANLSHAQLAGASLVRANLSRALLNNVNLSKCNLRGANLKFASLFSANLRHCDLRRANLRGAKLRNCDLRHAQLRRSDLSGADLNGARVGTANWLKASGARVDAGKWIVRNGIIRRK